MKKNNIFKRILSLVLSFSLALSLFGDLSLSAPLFADEVNYSNLPKMHIMVGYWGDNNVTSECYLGYTKEKNIVAYRDEGGNNSIDDVAEVFATDSALDDATDSIAITIKDIAGYEFSGFAISAGYEAVTVHDEDPENPYFTIEYTEDVHLVKIHVFYTEDINLVEGLDMKKGVDLNVGREQDTAFYLKATKVEDGTTTVYYSTDPLADASDVNVSLDAKGNFVYSLKDPLKIEANQTLYNNFKEYLNGISDTTPWNITVVKRYDNSAGLHTDKTVTAAEEDPEGSRKFDVTLESWFSGNAIADVGLILDASGSMAFISDGLVPYHPDLKAIDLSGIEDEDKKLEALKNVLLTPEQVNKILDKNLTDNSKLGYSDYTYFVFDRRKDTREFAPLGYWEGYTGDSTHLSSVELAPTVDPLTVGLVGHWNFDSKDNRYLNLAKDAETDGNSAINMTHPADGGQYTEKSSESLRIITDHTYSEDKDNGDYAKALNLSRNARQKSNEGAVNSGAGADSGFVLDVDATDSFTLAFAVKSSKNLTVSNTIAAPIVTIGGKNGYQVVRAGNKSTKRLKFGDYKEDNNPSGISLNNIFTNNDSAYSYITIVVTKEDDGTITANSYVNGSNSESTATLNNELTDNRQIVFGGYWDDTYKGNDIIVDEIYLYNRALSADEVKGLYNLVTTGDSEIAPGVAEGVFVALSQKDGSKEDILATMDKVTENNNPNNLAGWYYVNSDSAWEGQYGDETVATAKDYRYAVGGDAVENRILISDLPTSAQLKILSSLGFTHDGTKFEDLEGSELKAAIDEVLNTYRNKEDHSPQEELDLKANGRSDGTTNKAYIATGSNDFTYIFGEDYNDKNEKGDNLKQDDKKAIIPIDGSDKIQEFSIYNDKDYEEKFVGEGKESPKATDLRSAISLPADADDRQHFTAEGNKYSSPLLFFIDGMGYLRCVFSNSNKTTEYGDTESRLEVSYVYKKDDSTRIKAEELQYALGTFNSELEQASPNSRVSAVRFSTQNATEVKNALIVTEGAKEENDHLDNLVLLDWTKNAKAATQMLSIQRGDGSSLGSEEQKIIKGSGADLGDEMKDDKENLYVYNYGLTGGTNTLVGFLAYKKKLDTLDETTSRAVRADEKREEGKKKYLIIFTDGKDSNVQNYDPDKKGDAKNDNYHKNIENTYQIAKDYRNDGYTIFFVLLTGGAFSVDSSVKEFIANIAGDKDLDEIRNTALASVTNPEDAGEVAERTERVDEYYNSIALTLSDSSDKAANGEFVFEASTGEQLNSAFSDYILGAVSDALRDYTVQDYIDPRFDFVDDADNKYVLKQPAADNIPNIEVVSSDGESKHATLKTIDGITGQFCEVKVDGETALLGYDSVKSMYFIRWIDQDIPGCTTSDPDIPIWKSKITLEAKEDFIGGNAVLTNGNAADENYVMAEKDEEKSSGVSHSIRPTENDDADVSKGFPRTAANVRLYEPKMGKPEQTIYLGETITPEDIINALGKSMSTPPEPTEDDRPEDIAKAKKDYAHSGLYWDYIERYCNFAPGGGTFEDRIENLISTARDNKGAPASFTLPYQYIPDPKDTSVFTGDDAHQNDVLGRITYTLTSTPLDGKETPKTGEDYITFVTKDRVYTLSVKFEAANITADTAAGDTKVDLKSRQSLNGGLTNEKEEMEGEGNVTRYVWKPTNKPAAGAEQSKKETTGSKTYKIVEGEINFGLVMSQDDYNYITTHFNKPGQIGYTASLSREYPAAAAAAISEASSSPEAMGTYHPTLSFTKVEESKPTTDGEDYVSYLPLELSEGAKAKYDSYYLPIGKYALTGSSDETTLPITFGDIENVAVTSVNSNLIFDRSQKEIDDKISVDKFSTYAAAYSGGAFLLGGDGKSEGYTNQRLGLARIRATVDKGDLTVKKVLNKHEGDEDEDTTDFTFKLTVTYNEKPLEGEFDFEKSSEPTKGSTSLKDEYSFTLKGGESITFKDLPAGAKYTVTEECPDGYTQVSATNDVGEILEGGVTATFTNIENTPVTEIISASKKMTGDRTDLNATLDIYEFTLTAKDGAPMPEGSTSAGCKVTNNPDGSISFGEISYDTPGTYQYTIEETSVGAKGVTVDTASYTVTVEVGYKNKNEGTLEVKDVTYSYEKDGKSGTATSAEFTNKYTYAPLTKSYSFNISKTLTGPIDLNSEISKVFTFTVERTSAPESIRDHIVPDFVKQEIEVTVSGSGESYSGITNPAGAITDTYTVPGTYKYEIKEVVPDPEPDGMIYSGATYTLTVVVKDNNEGSLEVESATWATDGGELSTDDGVEQLTFENKYVPASVDIPISKTLKGGDTFDSAVTFTFNAELTSFSGNMDDLGADVKSSSATVNVLSKAESGSDKFTIGQFTKAGTYTYTVTETQSIDPALPTGGQMDYSEKEYTVIVTVTDEAEGLIAKIEEVSEKTDGEYTELSLKFTNKYTAPGSLKISKTLKNSEGTEVNGVDFEFTVTLTPPHGVTLSGQYGGATFTDDDKDGTYTGTVTVSSGDSVTLEGLPAGTEYTVTENSKPGYTQTDKSGDSGEIAAEATKQATFTNIKNTPVTAPISASKTITGDRTELIDDDVYEFILTAIDDAPMPAGSTPAGFTASNNSDGSISFGEISYDTPGTYRYTIEETPVNDNGVTSDGTVYTVTVEVGYENEAEGILKATVTYSEGGEPVNKEKVIFTNTYKHEQVSGDYSFNISKTLAGPVDNISDFNKEFNFKVTRTYSDNTSSGSPTPFADMTVTVNKDAFGNYTGEVSNTISDTYTAPGTYTYTITEDVPEPAQNGLAYSEATYTLTVVVVDDNKGKLVVTSATWAKKVGETFETIVETEPTLEFTNTYDPTATSVNIPVSKTFTGNTLNKDVEFTFNAVFKSYQNTKGITTTISPDDAPQSGSKTISVTGDSGSGTIALNGFKLAGTYTYTVTEANSTESKLPDDSSIDYDAGSYTVTVVVIDENGELKVQSTAYSYSDETANRSTTEAQFVNVYKPAPTTVTLSGSKTISGRNWNSANDDGKYSFTVSTAEDYGENVTLPTDPTVKNGADGTFSFSPITISAAGTYKFEITENDVTDVPGMTKDVGSYTVTVVVTDNGGTLVAGTPEYSYSDKTADRSTTEAQFVNVYKPAPATDIIKVNKKLTLDGEPQSLAGKSYTFTIEKVDGDCDPADGIVLPENPKAEIKIVSEDKKAATATFDAITFNKAGKYKVKISEVDPGDEIEKPDDITVTYVVKDEDGQLVATPTYNRADKMFENKIRVKSDVVISKKQATTGEFTTDLLTVEAGAEVEYQIEVTASGNVAAKNVVVTDVVPDGLTLVDRSISEGGTYDKDTKTITWNIGTLATGKANQKTLSFKVTVPKVTETTTWDNVAAVKFNDNPEPKESDKVTVRENPPISVEIPVSKTFTGNTLKDLVTFTFNAELTSYKDSEGNITNISADKAPQSGSTIISVTGDTETDGTIALNGFKLAGTYTYTVTEETSANPAIPDKNIDYDAGSYTVSFTITEQDDGTLVHGPLSFTYSESGATRSTEKAEFVNTYKPLGDLTISKSVDVSDGDEFTGETFTFDVQLEDDTFAGTVYDDSDKSYTFTAGHTTVEITVTSEDESSVTLKGLPVGEVTVTEQDIEGYTVDGNKEKSATIHENETGKVEFVNIKDAPLGDLTISKSVVDSDEQPTTDNTEFSFKVKLADTSFNETVSGYKFKNGETTVTVNGGSSVTLKGLPVGGVTVTEQDIEGYTPKDGSEKTATIPEDGTGTVEFVNIKDAPLGDLTISKSVVDSDEQPITDTTEFSFKVKLADTSFNETVSGYKFENGETTVTVEGGSSVTLHDLPVGGVTVTEQETEGYTVEGNKEKSATILENETGKVEFVNIKDAPPLGHPDITIEKSQTDGANTGELINVVIGDAVTYSITVKNTGDEKAENVTVTDAVPEGLIFAGGITEGGTLGEDGKTITWTIPTLEVGAEKTLSFDVTVPTVVESKTWKNIATIVSYTDPNDDTPDTPEEPNEHSNEVTLRYEPERGSLTVSKTVTGDLSSNSDIFKFTVTLFNGSDVAAEINGAYGGMTFINGVATFTLSGGQSVKAERIPVGLTYTVTEVGEVDINGNTVADSGYTVTSPASGTATGNITSTGSTAAFINDKSAPPQPTGDLTVSKTVTGNAANFSDVFRFTVTLYNNGVQATDINGAYGEMIFTNGVATIDLMHQGSNTATGLPAGYTYTVTEDGVLDANGTPIPGSVGGLTGYRSSMADGGNGVIPQDAEANVVFTNIKATGKLTVSKAVSPGTSAPTAPTAFNALIQPIDLESFNFTVTLYNGSDVAAEINGVYGDMTFINGIATFTLSGGDSKTATDIPAGLTYTVSENVYPEYDQYVGDATAPSTQNLVSSGVIPEGDDPAIAAFTNIKKQTPQPKGSLTLKKNVAVDGYTGGETFTFTVTLYNGLNVATDITGTYGDMIFTNGVATVELMHNEQKTATGIPAGYTYTVTETNPNGYIPDFGEQSINLFSGFDPYLLFDAAAPSKSGTITANSNETVVCNNTKPAPTLGDLKITKKVVDDDNIPIAGGTFTFDVQLDDTGFSGIVYDDFNNPYTFTAGHTTVEIAVTSEGGSSVTLKGLPVGGVTVTEQDAVGYSVNGSKVWTETVKNGAEIEVLFTNTKLVPEISISKTQNGETKKLTVKAGDTVVYSLEVKNTGKANAENVTVSDTIPDGLTLADVSDNISDGGKLGEDGKTITWNIGTLEPGANTTVSFKVTVPTVDEHTEWPNVGLVTYTDPNDPSKPDDPIESNEVVIESDPEPEPELDHPEITISKTQNGETKKLTVKAGDTVVYSLEVKNTGKANAENVTVSDVIPDGLTLVEESISEGGTLGADGKTITWNIGTLAPGANTTVSFKVTVPTVEKHTEWPNVGEVTYTDPNDPSKPDTPIESNEVVIESEPEPVVPEVKTGSLSLIKVVINQYGALISDARTFVFDIELVNSDFSGTLNGVTFTNGRGVAAVTAGQKLVIDGLPDGAEYKITERPTAGYLLRTDMSSGMWGYISENAEAEAWIYNMISTGNPPVIPPEIPPYEPENPPFIPDIDSPTEPNIIDDVEETDNPKTGLGLAPIFGAFAAAVAAISKRRKK